MKLVSHNSEVNVREGTIATEDMAISNIDHTPTRVILNELDRRRS